MLPDVSNPGNTWLTPTDDSRGYASAFDGHNLA